MPLISSHLEKVIKIVYVELIFSLFSSLILCLTIFFNHSLAFADILKNVLEKKYYSFQFYSVIKCVASVINC